MKGNKIVNWEHNVYSGIKHRIKKVFPYLLRSAVGFILVASCIAAYFPAKTVFGDSSGEVETITLDAAVQSAIKNSSQLPKLDITIESLNRQKDSLVSSRDTVQGVLDDAANVNSSIKVCNENIALYQGDPSKTAELAAEQAKLGELTGQLMYLQQMLMQFGIFSTELNEKSEFKQIIKTFDFGEYELEANISNLQINKKMAESSIITGVHSLYTGILSLNDAYTLQIKSYESMKKQYDIVCSKYKNGQASDMDKLSAEDDMKKAKLNADITKRKIDNMYMTLKGQMGISLSKSINLAPYSGVQKDASSLDDYLKKALENRSEVKVASNNFDLKKREFNTTKKYMEQDSIEWKEADEAQTESEFALKDAQNNVTKDIKTGYADVLKKKKMLESAELKKKNALQILDKMKENYKLGYTTDSDLQNYEMLSTQADAGYSSAQRDYCEAVYLLETASGVGPKYVMDMTGGK